MFEVTLETEGIQQLEQMLSALSKLGSSLNAVELHSRRREPYELKGKRFGAESTNAEVLHFLKLQKRDFITQSPKDNEEIAKAGADEMERILKEAFSTKAVLDKWGKQQTTAAKMWAKAGGPKEDYFQSLEQFATKLTSQMLRAAMKKYMHQIVNRIETQTTNNPPFNDQLSAEWIEIKRQLTSGWTKPIGKLSGQLTDNINPDGHGSRNIRVKRR